MLFSLMITALYITEIPFSVKADSPVGKSYIAFIPRDEWNSYAGWYIIGQIDDTEYQIQVYNPAENTWDVCIDWTYIDQGDLHTHMDDLPGFWRTYRVVSTKPVQAIVTSGEGSNMVPAYTSAKYTGKDFTFLGNFKSSLDTPYPEYAGQGPYGAVVFGTKDGTKGVIELWKDDGDGTFDPENPQPDTLVGSKPFSIDTGQHFTFGTWEQGTTFWRVKSNNDVLAIRTAGDGDEDDPAISIKGRPFGKEFFFASPKHHIGPPYYPGFALGFRLRNMEDNPATVKIYDVLDAENPRLLGTYTVPARGLCNVPGTHDFRHDTYKIRYAKLVSDRLITVTAGQNIMRGDTIFYDSSITGDMKSYMTNMIFGYRGFYDDWKIEKPSYNEFVAVDEDDSIISVNPLLNVSDRTLKYYSSSEINKVYYRVNGTHKEKVLQPGRGSITFGSNTYLTGFYVESNTNLVWGGIGNRGGPYSSSRWTFSSDNRFILRHGGNGNCWILGIRAPDPWVETDVTVDKEGEGDCGDFTFSITVTNFGPQSVKNVIITDTLIDELEYIEDSVSVYLDDGVYYSLAIDGQTLTLAIDEMPSNGFLEPATVTLTFKTKWLQSIPQGSENTAVVHYEYWDPYWKWADKTISDTEQLYGTLGKIILNPFHDANQDGTWNTDEDPVTDPVAFRVFRLDENGTPVDSVYGTPDSDGKIVFGGLFPGEYYIETSDTLDYELTTEIPDGPIPVYCDSHSYDIGLHLAETGTILVKKFLDANENALWDDNEPPLQGIEFHLYGTTESGETVDLYMRTDENGCAEFEVLPGEYTIDISDDNGYTVTTKNIPLGPIMVESASSHEYTVGDWITSPPNCCLFRGLGYWKHQVNVHWVDHKGHAHETKEDMELWLEAIYDLHLSDIFGDFDPIYVDSSPEGGENAFNILQLGDSNTMEEILRAHLLTLEFNFVSGKANDCYEYDRDAVESLIWVAEWALNAQREDLYEELKDIIEYMNENPLGEIAVKNFLDINCNGMKDGNEPLIPVGKDIITEIQLYSLDYYGTPTFFYSPHIDENGVALFTGLSPGEYYLDFSGYPDELEVTTALLAHPIRVECDYHEPLIGIWWVENPVISCDQRGLGYWKEHIDWYWGKGKEPKKNKIPEKNLLAWMDEINELFFSEVFGDDDQVLECERKRGKQQCEMKSYPVDSSVPENALWIFECGPHHHSPAERLRQHLLTAEFNHVSGKFYCNGDEQRQLIEMFLWSAEWILIYVDPDTEEGELLYEQWKNWIEELNESGYFAS